MSSVGINELYKLVRADIEDRKTWEDRQGTAYKLRFNQIKRRLKPFPAAADLAWPLIDTAIEKIKPAYIEQVLGPELIGDFSSKNETGDGFKTAVSKWFDWRVKKCSNFERQIQHVIDTFCQNGKGFCKTMWDPINQRVRDESIYPTHCVVPITTEELAEADRCAHIMQISKQRYKRVADVFGYNPDPDFIDSIVGRGKENSNYDDSKKLREGLGWHSKSDIIVLWEVYERLANKQIKVWTFSPLMPEEEVRPPFMMPYSHKKIPIVQYDFEITDVGFYSPRGVAEIIQLYQNLLKMLLDMEMDYMISCNRPIWQPAEGAPATTYSNINLMPGEVLNARLTPLQFPTPPLDFTQRQQNVRGIAQERIMQVDYGLTDQNNPQNPKDRTATELNQLGAVKESGINMKARVFGPSLRQTLQMHWDLELQFRTDDLGYYYKRKYEQLDENALEQVYELEVSGGKDGYSREKRLQKLVQLRTMFAQMPYFKDDQCCRKIIETIDPDLIDDLFIDLNAENAQQILKQYDEISSMILGANPPVAPGDQDKDHIAAIEAFKSYCQTHPDKQVMIDVQVRIIQHEDAHLVAWRQKDPKGYAMQLQKVQGIQVMNKKLLLGILAQTEQGPGGGALGGGPPGGPPPIGGASGPPVSPAGMPVAPQGVPPAVAGPGGP